MLVANKRFVRYRPNQVVALILVIERGVSKN